MATAEKSELNLPLRDLPSVDELLRTDTAVNLAPAAGRRRLTELAREAITELRAEMLSNGNSHGNADELLAEAARRLEAAWVRRSRTALTRVINATGVIIHTNLGRAPLSDAAMRAIAETAGGYSTVEYDLASGKRGKRGLRAEELLCELTSAEAACIVNNCAAAALLVLSALAKGREVVISRGELVEIGGDFRIPDVLEQSGATLREVGATNRTRLSDYENAVAFETAMILRVHPSNYRIVGFTAKPELSELAKLAHDNDILLVEDAGSGAVFDLRKYGLSDEPVIGESLAAGADVVMFSGDKLLGGPQAGLIVGKAETIDVIRRHPLYRALRASKFVYAALEATLESFVKDTAEEEIPVLRMTAASKVELTARAEKFLEKLAGVSAEIVPGNSVIGGGSAPDLHPETALISVTHRGLSPNEIEERLRSASPPVITRLEEGRVLIDLRTVDPRDEDDLAKALNSAAA